MNPTAPNGGVWWYEDDPLSLVGRNHRCPGDCYCRGCGRAMVETMEHGTFDRSGRRKFHRWHSCPRFFMPWWRYLLTLGTGGMGHDSHDADEPMMTREWR